MMDSNWIKTFLLSELEENKMKVFNYRGLSIIICKVENNFYAFENRCSHEDYPLADGFLCGVEIECAKHGAKFNITNGAVLSMPAVIPIKTYQTKIIDNWVYVKVL